MQDRTAFAGAMEQFVCDGKLSTKYGEPARKRVIANFSFDAFTNQLTKIVDETAQLPSDLAPMAARLVALSALLMLASILFY